MKRKQGEEQLKKSKSTKKNEDSGTNEKKPYLRLLIFFPLEVIDKLEHTKMKISSLHQMTPTPCPNNRSLPQNRESATN